MGLIEWCDSKITALKQNKIEFKNGIPLVPEDMVYDGVPDFIETFQFRNEIPVDKRKTSLVAHFTGENRLWARLNKIEEDSIILGDYGGMVGMDVSPSINMLRPRQYHSMLINAIYNCLMALKGIKIATNARIGDIGTLNMISTFPKEKTLVFSNLGCRGKFIDYSMYIFERTIIDNCPVHICLYGKLSRKCINKLRKLNMDLTIYLYHEHNYCTNDKKSVFIIRSNEYTTNKPRYGHICELIVTHGIKKINTFDVTALKGGD